MQSSLDFIGVFLKNGQIGIADTHTLGYGQPIPDAVGNVHLIDFDLRDDWLRVTFMRALIGTDDNDKSLAGCQTFQLPLTGGTIEGQRLGKHTQTPHPLPVCDIVRNCVGARSQPMALLSAG